MKYFRKSLYTVLFITQFYACAGQTQHPISGRENSIVEMTNIRVIELRNYLVQSNEADKFNTLFVNHFLNPMQNMGVSVLGRYKIKNSEDHFVWIRGYKSMGQRVKFLNDFYFRNEAWKKYKKDANEMIRNSDNVYLLRPLILKETGENTQVIDSGFFDKGQQFAAVDFYIANTRLDELTAFYTEYYLPILKSFGFETTLWVSETAANDFPQLPVFQDNNLLVAITFCNSEKEYKAKLKKLKEAISLEMQTKMLDIVTIHNHLFLQKFNN